MMQAQQMAQAVEKLLKGPDLQREFKIEIETDSTIRADLSRAQQNISGFVTGLGEFMTSVGPAVQAGFMPPEIAVKFIGTFSRNFKLGREAEALTDEWVKFLEDKAKQPPQPSPRRRRPKWRCRASHAGNGRSRQRARQGRPRRRSAGHPAEERHGTAEKQAELAMKEKELQLKEREMGLKAQGPCSRSTPSRCRRCRRRPASPARCRAKDAEHEDARRASEIDFMKQKQAMRPNGAAR
jgi:hypothetical protein